MRLDIIKNRLDLILTDMGVLRYLLCFPRKSNLLENEKINGLCVMGKIYH